MSRTTNYINLIEPICSLVYFILSVSDPFSECARDLLRVEILLIKSNIWQLGVTFIQGLMGAAFSLARFDLHIELFSNLWRSLEDSEIGKHQNKIKWNRKCLLYDLVWRFRIWIWDFRLLVWWHWRGIFGSIWNLHLEFVV